MREIKREKGEGMRINRIRITIEPWITPRETMLEIEVSCNGRIVRNSEIIPEDHFNDMFSRIMKTGELKIREFLAKNA